MFPILRFLISLVVLWQADNPQEDVSNRVHTAGGLVISIDPAVLNDNGLWRQWQRIDDWHDGRKITGRPYSKTHAQIEPVQANGWAMARLSLNGTSVGESTTTSNAHKIVSDALTQFTVHQFIFLSQAGVQFSEPIISVKSNQSFKRASSKNVLFPALAKSTFKRRPDRIRATAEDFATRQLHRQVADLNNAMSLEFDRLANRWLTDGPDASHNDWHFFSDENRLYMAIGEGDVVGHAAPLVGPISLRTDANFLRQLLEQRLSGKKWDSDELNALYQQWATQLKLPQLAPSPKKPWSIQLEQRPVAIGLDDDAVNLTVRCERLTSGDKSIRNMEIQVAYRFQPNTSNVMLFERSGPVKIKESNASGEVSGARQTLLRSVMRKRLERIIPSTVSVPWNGEIVTAVPFERLRLRKVVLADDVLAVDLALQ